MRKTGFYLLLGMFALGSALWSCSDSDKDEPEPTPEPVPEEPAKPVYDTIVQFTNLNVSEFVNVGGPLFRVSKIHYNEQRLLDTFVYIDDATRAVGNVRVVWNEDGTVTMNYQQTERGNSTLTAVYTLNDKGWMEKVVAGNDQYEAKYTATRFELNKGSKNIYWGEIEAGGKYGDWTKAGAASFPGTTVHVVYPTENITKNYSGLDLFFLPFCGYDMPECIRWAYVAGFFPGTSQFYSKVNVDYGSKTNEWLFDMDYYENQSTETALIFSPDVEDYGSAFDDGCWGGGDVYASYEISVIERKAE